MLHIKHFELMLDIIMSQLTLFKLNLNLFFSQHVNKTQVFNEHVWFDPNFYLKWSSCPG